jgi:hypothetical protein
MSGTVHSARILELSTLPSTHTQYKWYGIPAPFLAVMHTVAEINQCYSPYWLLWEQQHELASHLCTCIYGHDIDVTKCPSSCQCRVSDEGKVLCIHQHTLQKTSALELPPHLVTCGQCPSTTGNVFEMVATPPGSSECFLDHAESSVESAACRTSACTWLPV